MSKTVASIMGQVRSLIGDYQETQFDQSQVVEAINFAQNLLMRRKGFKVTSKVYAVGAYPTGALIADWLSIKRVQLVDYALDPMAAPPITIANTPESTDLVLRVLDESLVAYEDASNELWRAQRASFLPRRYVITENASFAVVPPILPAGVTGNIGVRVHYVQIPTQFAASVPMTQPQLDATVDVSIPDYYQDAIRYAAVAYLMEKDTDLKSMQLKTEMMRSFEYHIGSGLEPLSVGEFDK